MSLHIRGIVRSNLPPEEVQKRLRAMVPDRAREAYSQILERPLREKEERTLAYLYYAPLGNLSFRSGRSVLGHESIHQKALQSLDQKGDLQKIADIILEEMEEQTTFWSSEERQRALREGMWKPSPLPKEEIEKVYSHRMTNQEIHQIQLNMKLPKHLPNPKGGCPRIPDEVILRALFDRLEVGFTHRKMDPFLQNVSRSTISRRRNGWRKLGALKTSRTNSLLEVEEEGMLEDAPVWYGDATDAGGTLGGANTGRGRKKSVCTLLLMICNGHGITGASTIAHPSVGELNQAIPLIEAIHSVVRPYVEHLSFDRLYDKYEFAFEALFLYGIFVHVENRKSVYKVGHMPFEAVMHNIFLIGRYKIENVFAFLKHCLLFLCFQEKTEESQKEAVLLFELRNDRMALRRHRAQKQLKNPA